MKLYEFTGYVLHSIVVAANSEEEARKALGDNWAKKGDEIGVDVKDVDLCDIREIEYPSYLDNDGMKQVYDDLAHIVVY